MWRVSHVQSRSSRACRDHSKRTVDVSSSGLDAGAEEPSLRCHAVAQRVVVAVERCEQVTTVCEETRLSAQSRVVFMVHQHRQRELGATMFRVRTLLVSPSNHVVTANSTNTGVFINGHPWQSTRSTGFALSDCRVHVANLLHGPHSPTLPMQTYLQTRGQYPSRFP